jgi:hypothetical protein
MNILSKRSEKHSNEITGAVITAKLLPAKLPDIIMKQLVQALPVDEMIVRIALLKFHFGIVSTQYVSEIMNEELQEQLMFLYTESLKHLVDCVMQLKYSNDAVSNTEDLRDDLRELISKDELVSIFPTKFADEIINRWSRKISNATMEINWKQIELDSENKDSVTDIAIKNSVRGHQPEDKAESQIGYECQRSRQCSSNCRSKYFYVNQVKKESFFVFCSFIIISIIFLSFVDLFFALLKNQACFNKNCVHIHFVIIVFRILIFLNQTLKFSKLFSCRSDMKWFFKLAFECCK